ncbi:hypothetical protein [Hutsoniella sourekii]|uniref:hypothetical protein n=1 Tax=Hutsoniella sourekii TaxID=87650 RepID=UPI0004873ECA|nr:hypothetical protein [Hutsoniella sourekii]
MNETVFNNLGKSYVRIATNYDAYYNSLAETFAPTGEVVRAAQIVGESISRINEAMQPAYKEMTDSLATTIKLLNKINWVPIQSALKEVTKAAAHLERTISSTDVILSQVAPSPIENLNDYLESIDMPSVSEIAEQKVSQRGSGYYLNYNDSPIFVWVPPSGIDVRNKKFKIQRDTDPKVIENDSFYNSFKHTLTSTLKDPKFWAKNTAETIVKNFVLPALGSLICGAITRIQFNEIISEVIKFLKSIF